MAHKNKHDIIFIMLLERILQISKKIIPKKLFTFIQPTYHFMLAFIGSVLYGFPSKKMKIIGITGTKGKSSVAEILNHVLEDLDQKTAISGTIHFKINKKDIKNTLKQSMPGRFFLQKFLSDAKKEKVDWTIIEMTSEGALQFRNYFIKLNAFIFTNIAPEHLESHGGFENYKKAKLSIIKNSLEKNRKKNKVLIVNGHDKYADEFLDFNIPNKYKALKDEVQNLKADSSGISFVYKNIEFSSPLPGEYNFLNIFSIIKFCEHYKFDLKVVSDSLKNFKNIPGRNDEVETKKDFRVIVDYAHTLNSMEAIYKTFKKGDNLICVLGSAGGGRDKWVRPEKGKLAEKYCREIILTDEDPYDEDPREIISDIEKGMKSKKYIVELDRNKAIKKAINMAKKGDVVLTLAKGSESVIVRKNGERQAWSDRKAVEDALKDI